MDWEAGELALGSGDYATISVQYRIGDGRNYKDYPTILGLSFGLMVPYVLGNATSIADARRSYSSLQSKPNSLLWAKWDMKYIEEYFMPYFEDPDSFAPLRMGSVVGIHEVHIHTGSQMLTLRHEAVTRSMLAEGAVDAARFLAGKAPGLYDMSSMLR